MQPILLPANQPLARFYAGGSRISAFRHVEPSPPHTPEDWVGSTTSVRGRAPTGLTMLATGELLADAVERDPQSWLGPEHVERFGADTMLLVKLLDAGQRLPVHAHPSAAFASAHVAARHGKAEAWYILAPGVVHVGLVRDVPLEHLRELVATQQVERMLALLHAIEVAPGDTVFVPPGVLHAIGAGILLVEVQEPEDLSILLEWTGFDIDGETDGHLGLGFDRALTAVETTARTAGEVAALVRRGVERGPTLVPDAARYFRLDRVSGPVRFPAGFAIVLCVTGAATITIGNGIATRLSEGTTLLVPFACGAFDISGDAVTLVARPPLGR